MRNIYLYGIFIIFSGLTFVHTKTATNPTRKKLIFEAICEFILEIDLMFVITMAVVKGKGAKKNNKY